MKTATVLCLLVQLMALGSINAQAMRAIEFSVYGQYPLHDIAFKPVDPAAISLGHRSATPIAIQSHTLTRSGPYPFKGARSIQFYNTQTAAPVGRVRLPEESNQWLLLFIHNPRHPQNPAQHPKYLIYPFDDSTSNLPNNSLVFLNLSGKRLDGLIENTRIHIGHGASGVFRAQERSALNLWMRGSNGDTLLQALTKTYHFKPNHRHLMIFFPPVLSGSADLDVRVLSTAPL
jgi:hypothetical protein